MKKILPAIILSVGFFLISLVIFPIASSYIKFQLQPKLIDPSAVTALGKPVVVNVLGVSTTDYTNASNWFNYSLPAATNSNTKVKYFTLSIPKLKLLDVPIEINGTDLKKNGIHFPGSALPGELGNSVIYGHSAMPQIYHVGNPLTLFNPLLDIRVGDEIVANFDGVIYRYIVRKTAEVDPSEISVLAQAYDRYEMTLITCVPLGTYWHRFVVRAELVN